jgi:hypothetical protein
MDAPEQDHDDADFVPLPEGYSEEPQPFTEDQISDLRALFRTGRSDA